MTNRAEIVITALDKASAVVNRISDRFDVLGQKSNLTKSFERLGKTAGLERVNDSLSKIAGNVKAVAMYGGLAAGAIGLAFHKSVGTIDDFADSMANAGIKGKELVEISALRDYLVQFGVGSEDASTALVKLTGNMSGARAGNKELQAAFEAAGITMADLKTKSPVEVLQKMMDIFSQSDKAGAKLKVLHALAGKGSVKMADGLSQGVKALEDYKVKSKNALLTEKDFADAGTAADSLTRIGGLVTRLAQKMAVAAAPKVQAFLDRREAGLLELIPKLVDWVDRFMDSIDEKKVMQFMDDVGSVFSALGSVFRWLTENVNTTLLVITALGLVFAPTIAALVSIGTVVIPLLIGAVAALGWPFILVIGAIQLLIAAAYMLYKNWDRIILGLKEIWQSLAEVISAVWALVTGAAQIAIDKICSWFEGLFDAYVAVWTRIGQWFVEKLKVLTSMLPNWLTGGSLNVNVNGAAATVQTSAQTVANAATNKTEVGGRLTVEVIGGGAKVTQLSSANDRVPIDVASGLYGVGG